MTPRMKPTTFTARYTTSATRRRNTMISTGLNRAWYSTTVVTGPSATMVVSMALPAYLVGVPIARRWVLPIIALPTVPVADHYRHAVGNHVILVVPQRCQRRHARAIRGAIRGGAARMVIRIVPRPGDIRADLARGVALLVGEVERASARPYEGGGQDVVPIDGHIVRVMVNEMGRLRRRATAAIVTVTVSECVRVHICGSAACCGKAALSAAHSAGDTC